MAKSARFTKQTIDFLTRAGRETSPDWLKIHAKEHEEHLVKPLSRLAEYLAEHLRLVPAARRYKFPLRGFGRLRRPKHKVDPGEPAYRHWVHLRASQPSDSLFDENPGLYFYLSNEEVFAGGGLYDASYRQVKQLRPWMAEDPKELRSLLSSKAFKREFPRGLETKKSLKTYPRGYDPDHKRIEWLRLQAYYVTRKFTRAELYSEGFKDLVLENWEQTLKLNELLSAHFTIDDWRTRKGRSQPDSADEEVSVEPELWDDRL